MLTRKTYIDSSTLPRAKYFIKEVESDTISSIVEDESSSQNTSRRKGTKPRNPIQNLSKETFLAQVRSKKFLNSYSIHTQQHRSSHEIRLALDLYFGVE
jgi:hypothetical protein